MATPMFRSLPAGFSEELSPILSERVAELTSRLRKAGPIRLLVVAKAGGKEAEAGAALAAQPEWAAQKKAPGVYEATVLPEQVAELVARPDLYRWLDLATRFFGSPVDGPADRVVVSLRPEGGAWKKEHLSALERRGFPGKPDASGRLAFETTGGKLADLAAVPFLSSIGIQKREPQRPPPASTSQRAPVQKPPGKPPGR